MTADQTKILAHLASRKQRWVHKEEIRGAWEFDDFNVALNSLLKEELISELSPTVGLTPKGKKTLKEM